MPILGRKNFKYKQKKNVVKPPKTSRTEMSPVMRAFCVGAMTAMRGDYTSHKDLATQVSRTQTALSKLLQRIEKKRVEHCCAIWEEILYKNDLGRDRSKLLTQEQKSAIIAIVTFSRNDREKESWQAIQDGDFNAIIPVMNVTTFENVVYEAGYARRRPSWKPSLTPDQEKERLVWALDHNPDHEEEYNDKGFNFYEVVFTDETPARIGEGRGMQRIWYKEDERWDEGVKHGRNRKDCCLQFYGRFRYDHKGPYHVYHAETDQEKAQAEAHIQYLNHDARIRDNKLQIYARASLDTPGESDANSRYNTRKRQYVPSQMDCKRGDRTRGGVDGYRHREGALKKLAPWIKSLEKKGIRCKLLQDGAPAHKSRIARDFLIVEHTDRLWWPDHSPEINASEHAWPWIRRHVTKEFTPSCTAMSVTSNG